MRVLFVSQTWEPDEGPPQRRLRRFADALVAAGHHVTVVTAPPHYPTGALTSSDPLHAAGAVDTSQSGLTVCRTAFRPHSQTLCSRIADQAVVALSTVKVALSRRRFGERPDLVLAAVPALPSAASAQVIAAVYQVPLVIDLRDAWPDLLGNVASWAHSAPNADSPTLALQAAAVRHAGKAAEKAFLLLFRRAQHIIVTSQRLERSLSPRLSRPVTTIVNSPRCAVATAHQPAHRPSSAATSTLHVLYGGTVGRAQGMHSAIRAADIAQRNGAALILRIVGQGAELNAVRQLAEQINAPVEFLEPVLHEQMAEHYRWCDAALVHLRDWEPLQQTIPSKMIEAMALGVPVIVAADGEAAEITRSTGAGAAIAAMDPHALAKIFEDWAAKGAPAPDESAVKAWLEMNADPVSNASRFVELIEFVGNSAPSQRVTMGQHAKRLVGLVHRAVEIGREDPVRLFTLVSRRLPSAARSTVTPLSARLAPPGGLRGLAYIIGDEQRRAAEQYAAAREGRVKSYLGFHLNKASGTSSRNLVARRAWELGDMDGAVALLRPTSRSATRWSSIRRVLSPEFELAPGHGRQVPLPLQLVDHLTKLKVAQPGLPPRPMRILHVLTNSLPHTNSGYTVRSHSVLRAENSAGMVAVGVTRIGYPETIGVPTGRPFDVVDGVTYARLSAPTVPFQAERRLSLHADHLSSVVRVFRPDLLHTTTNYENAIVTREVARRFGLPWVYETRGEMEQTWLSKHLGDDYETARASQFYRAVRAIEARMMKEADAVIALSLVQKRSHISRGVPSKKIHVVRNSVGTDTLAIPRRSSALARGILELPEKFTVGTVSSLVPYEGIDTLLHAIYLLRAAGHDIRGLIVGDGTARPDLQDLSETLGLADAVTFPGHVPYEKVVDWYDAIDVFCIPRRDVHVTRSVTPLKPLQAMGRWRPLIVSDLEALTEFTTDLGAGISVPPESPDVWAAAILRLKDEPSLYDKYSAAGRRAAESSTWEDAISIYTSVYNTLRGEKQ